jgi:hypothetical protein
VTSSATSAQTPPRTGRKATARSGARGGLDQLVESGTSATIGGCPSIESGVPKAPMY